MNVQLKTASLSSSERTSKSAKPFIKWVGGKQAIARTLTTFFPQSFEKYYEPFLGGGSVFFTLAPRMAILSDENKWLADTYLALRNDWRKVVNYLEKMINTNEEFLKI